MLIAVLCSFTLLLGPVSANAEESLLTITNNLTYQSNEITLDNENHYLDICWGVSISKP